MMMMMSPLCNKKGVGSVYIRKKKKKKTGGVEAICLLADRSIYMCTVVLSSIWATELKGKRREENILFAVAVSLGRQLDPGMCTRL